MKHQVFYSGPQKRPNVKILCITIAVLLVVLAIFFTFGSATLFWVIVLGISAILGVCGIVAWIKWG